MPVMRSVLLIAAPALTALLGLLWFTRRKKGPSVDYKKPPDKSKQPAPVVIEQEKVDVVQSGNSAVGSPEVAQPVDEPVTAQSCNLVNATPPSRGVSEDNTQGDEGASGDRSEEHGKMAAVSDLAEVVDAVEASITAELLDMKIEQAAIPEPTEEKIGINNNVGKVESDGQAGDAQHVVGPNGDCSSSAVPAPVEEGDTRAEGPADQSSQSYLAQEQMSETSHVNSVEPETVVASVMEPSLSDEETAVHVSDTNNCCAEEGAKSPPTETTSESGDNNRAQDDTNNTESNHCDIPAVDDQVKSEAVEAEVSEVTRQADSSSSSASESKVPSPVSTPESDDHSEMSGDSGKGPSIGELALSGEPRTGDVTTYEFHFPTDLCGLLIGKHGKQITTIKDQSGARISVKRLPYMEDFQAVYMEGTEEQVEKAVRLLKRRFPEARYPQVDFTNTLLESGPVLQPEMMQLNLPEGVSLEVIVSSVVQPNHVFVQQPTHPTFPMLERMNQCMNMCYVQDGIVPQLPRPIEVGVICAAPMYNGWYRSQVVQYHEDSDECDIRYVDYGGYMRIQGCLLRQIRSDFTTLPFQAVECYLANVIPPKGQESFPEEALALLESIVQSKLLNVEVVAHEEDGVPYIQLYELQGEQVALVNRTLVDQGLAQWLEHV